MSEITKHKGVVEATGSRCIVVFRELPEDPDTALVCFVDSLPEVYAMPLGRIVSTVGQTDKDLYNVLTREYTSEGKDFLTTLHQLGRLHPVKTTEILMQVTPQSNIRLSELNKMIRGETADVKEPQDFTNKGDKYKVDVEAEEAAVIAYRLLGEAEDFENEALRKRERAFNLVPELREKFTSVKEETPLDPNFFSIDLSKTSQRQAIQMLQEQWRAVNPKTTTDDAKPNESIKQAKDSMEQLSKQLDEGSKDD